MFYKLLAYGHVGITKTLVRIVRDYYFLGIRAKVKKVVLKYDVYIRNKAT